MLIQCRAASPSCSTSTFVSISRQFQPMPASPARCHCARGLRAPTWILAGCTIASDGRWHGASPPIAIVLRRFSNNAHPGPGSTQVVQPAGHMTVHRTQGCMSAHMTEHMVAHQQKSTHKPPTRHSEHDNVMGMALRVRNRRLRLHPQPRPPVTNQTQTQTNSRALPPGELMCSNSSSRPRPTATQIAATASEGVVRPLTATGAGG